MIVHVIVFIAQKYPKVKKGVEEIMVGRIIEFEEKKYGMKVLERGAKSWKEDAKNMKRSAKSLKEDTKSWKGRNKTVRNMFCDRMDISLIEKYTNLSCYVSKNLSEK